MKTWHAMGAVLFVVAGVSVSCAQASGTDYAMHMGSMMMGQGGTTSAGGETSPAKGSLGAYVDSHNLSCFSCHAMSGRGVGPSFTEIAQRYAGQAGAQEMLSSSITEGVSGKWGGYRAMPGGLASPAQARELVRLILSLGKNG